VSAPVSAPQPKPAPGNTNAPQDTERKLAAQRAEYEARMRDRAKEKNQPRGAVSPETMLEKTANRLFSEGRAAASLGGQRQLVYWMAQAVPRLNGLIRQPVGKQFFAMTLRDDPDDFLPILDTLLAEAVRLLQSKDPDEESRAWQDADPDILCAGWYALTRFAVVSQEGLAFLEEARLLEAHFKRNKSCSAWLREQYQAIGEEKGDGSEDADGVYA
jgi:hypothetical protein